MTKTEAHPNDNDDAVEDPYLVAVSGGVTEIVVPGAREKPEGDGEGGDCVADQPSPEETAAWYTFPTLSWLTPFMRTATRRPLQAADLFRLHPKFSAGRTTQRMRDRIARGMREAGLEDVDGPTRPLAGMPPDEAKARRRRRTRAIKWSIFWDGILSWPTESAVAFTLHAMGSIGNVASPIVLNQLLNFLADPGTNGSAFGYSLCVCLFVAQMMVAFGWNCSQYIQRNVAMSVKASVISVLFRKSLTISTRARAVYNNGRTLNLMASDASNLESFYTYLYDIVLLPAEVIALSILLIVYTGPAGVAGLAFMVVSVAVQMLATSNVLKYERDALQATDERVNLTSEVLGGIRVIKYFAWEPFFSDRINKLRDRELGHIRVLRYIMSSFLGVLNILPTSVALITFVVYWGLGNSLSSATVFTTISIISALRMPISLVPQVAQRFWSSLVSIERVARFLAVGDTDSPPDVHARDDPAFVADDIVVDNATFAWEVGTAEEFDIGDADEIMTKALPKAASIDTVGGDASMAVDLTAASNLEDEGGQIMHLKDIDFKATRGTLTVVVGKVGAGKSSILHAIIGDMKRIKGKVSVFGSIAFASQTPWLQNATLRANVLFGQPYDPARYAAVIRACALERDLTLLSHGDASEIGEKGVTLSGGQAARVNLARAVYTRSDILLLDDPLSAVDAHVGRTLMEECVLGLCKGRTVVLVTHQVQVAAKADRVVLVDKGRVVEDGRFAELAAKPGGAFAAMMREHGGAEAGGSDAMPRSEEQVNRLDKDVVGSGGATGALMTTEEREEGAVKAEFYGVYFRMSGGYGVVAAIVLACMVWQVRLLFVIATDVDYSQYITQAERVLTDLWLAFWVSREFSGWTDRDYVAGFDYTYWPHHFAVFEGLRRK
ncbi:hypothetical protein HK101_011203 [Irineochytrium annulatum]|nr:hypothetical protein HK101_011203 [Irineochytrium annulatum]